MKYIRVLSEALLPVLGFTLWNWSLYFILLYYLLDLLADVVITHLKSQKIIEHQGASTKTWVRKGTIGALLFVSVVLLLHLAVKSIFLEIDFVQEAISFWKYEDLGIEQGYLLLPLVAFASFQQYKIEFVRFKQYESLLIEHLWNGKIIAYGIILIFSIAVILISQFMRFDEAVYVYGIIAITSGYQFLKDNII